jgi:multidrug efflux pump subunit AcrA (membrane-fusion protein)
MKLQTIILSVLLAAVHAEEPSASTTIIRLDDAAIKTLGIETEEAAESEFEETAFALGEIVEIPNRHSVLSSRIPGRITGITVQEGDTVTAGQPLVTVESRQPGDPPPSVQLKAPMGGLVVQSHVRLGEPVEPDKELLDISDLGEVWAIARVPQHHAGQLKAGSRAHLIVPALGSETIEGEMLRFGTTADPTGGTIDAVFRVDNPGLRMRPGMRVEFNVVLSSRSGVLSVPRTALQGGPANRHVFVTDFNSPNFFHRTPVRAGQISGDRVEILNGIFPGDEVVTTGSYPLGFAGGGAVSAREALEAAHGHKHNEDGSEPSAAQEAAQKADEHADEGHSSGAPPWRERIFMATTAVLALLLVVMSFIKRRPETTTTEPS